MSALLGTGFSGVAQAQAGERSVVATPAAPPACDGSGYTLTEGQPYSVLETTHYWHTDNWVPSGRITVPRLRTIRLGLSGSQHDYTTKLIMSRARKYVVKDQHKTPISVTRAKSYKGSPGFYWVPLKAYSMWGQYTVFHNTYRVTLCDSRGQIVWSDHGTWTVPIKGLHKTKSS